MMNNAHPQIRKRKPHIRTMRTLPRRTISVSDTMAEALHAGDQVYRAGGTLVDVLKTIAEFPFEPYEKALQRERAKRTWPAGSGTQKGAE